ncbi:hypothetical protein, partial [Clostridium sp.]
MIFLKKLSVIGMVLLFSIVILVGCKKNKPEIKTVITLGSITTEEYKQISDSSKLQGVSIDDLKKLYIDIKIINSKKATNRAISIPDLYIIDRQDKVRTVGGGTTEQNNIGKEDTTESMAFIIFDTRGLSEDNISSLYNNSDIKVSYKLNNSEIVE